MQTDSKQPYIAESFLQIVWAFELYLQNNIHTRDIIVDYRCGQFELLQTFINISPLAKFLWLRQANLIPAQYKAFYTSEVSPLELEMGKCKSPPYYYHSGEKPASPLNSLDRIWCTDLMIWFDVKQEGLTSSLAIWVCSDLSPHWRYVQMATPTCADAHAQKWKPGDDYFLLNKLKLEFVMR